MSWMENLNLDDISQCPIDPECAGCGGSPTLGNRVLDVVTMDSNVGVLCLTVCQGCSPEGWTLPLVWTVNRVLEHCEHLGITSDAMAAKMKAEQR